MRIIVSCILSFAFLFSSVIARAESLKVAITPYNPPFIFPTNNNQFYGFDISIMQYICKKINRECLFVPMDFDELIPTVLKGTIPIAINSLTITLSRSNLVNFSNPYLPSECSFLVRADNKNIPLTSIGELNKFTFGVIKGDIFPESIRALGITEAPIKEYANKLDMIHALNQKDISILFLDAPAANYWQMESKGKFVVRGPQMPCGYGLGIIINKDDTALLKEINQAIDEYHQSPKYQIDYDRYIGRKTIL